jgi:hypothetical protein
MVMRRIGDLPAWWLVFFPLVILVVWLVVRALRGTVRATRREVADILWCLNMRTHAQNLARDRDAHIRMGHAEHAAWYEWQRVTFKELLLDASWKVPSYNRQLLRDLRFRIWMPAEKEDDEFLGLRFDILPPNKEDFDTYERRRRALVDADYLARDRAFMEAKKATFEQDPGFAALGKDLDKP